MVGPYRKFSVSCTIVLIWDGDISENSVGEADRVTGAVSGSWSSRDSFERSIRQSRMDPKSLDFSRGYWAVRIGASCSESPATMIRPVEVRDRNTRAADPRESCPASSITTQSTSNDRRLLKLYSYSKSV